MAEMPKGCTSLVIGNRTVDFEYPRDDREEAVAEVMDTLDVSCFTRHFGQRRGRLIRGRWTWRKRRRNRYIRSKPDYFLAKGEGREKVTSCNIKMSRHHEADHRAVVARL